jgi:predicted DNA-binding protein YlxM (UPF0122 family)
MNLNLLENTMKILTHVKQIEILENYETEDNSGTPVADSDNTKQNVFQERGRRVKPAAKEKVTNEPELLKIDD